MKKRDKNVLILVDGLDITNGVSVTCREIARNWFRVDSEWDLMVYGTSVIALKDETYRRACIRVEKSMIRIPVIGYKKMWLSIPIIELLKLFSSGRYGIIHSTTPGPIGVLGAIMAWILNKPLVMTHHTRMVDYMKYYAPAPIRPFITKLAKILFRAFYSMSSYTIAHSPATVDELCELKAKNIHYIPMGVDIPGTDPGEIKLRRESAGMRIRKEYGIPDTKKIIIYAGRIAKEKNLSLFAEVAQKMKHAFIIVGDGPKKKSLESCGNLILPGFKYGSDLSDMYFAADLFLCTSTSETLGKTLLEALAHGLPILVPDKGYHNSILSEDRQVVYRYAWGTEEETIKNIISEIPVILDATSDRDRTDRLAFEYAMKFSWKTIIPLHLEPYTEVTKRSR
ncbi:MAG: glycosyltransferase [Elusimicrobia bacterium]|nr:glycosyltransferase [Elusimicrobiota bacterium]